jgi:hypothetical protein
VRPSRRAFQTLLRMTMFFMPSANIRHGEEARSAVSNHAREHCSRLAPAITLVAE